MPAPLIGLQQIGQIEILDAVFDSVVVAAGVAGEVTPTLPILPPWIEVRPLMQPLGAQILAASLGRGESETMALALEAGISTVILDDLAARQLAARLGLMPLGTLGVLVVAKNRGVIPEVKPLLDALLAFDFRVSEALIKQILDRAGE